MCIFTLNILDQLRFDTSRVREFDDANGYFFQGREFGGAQPPRSGNDLELVIFDSTDKQGLQHALRLETGGQIRKTVFVKASARVGGGFLQLCHRQVAIFIAALNCGFHKILLLLSE
jgi:hypothetical protein